ncbi:hypothetical protein [Lysobacter brunescens]|uniref:Uncharacterized protein n=1 Tax=Lysobacter brunescens TaxID=262323 RepID=A0ABW2YGC4_9GAMM
MSTTLDHEIRITSMQATPGHVLRIRTNDENVRTQQLCTLDFIGERWLRSALHAFPLHPIASKQI